MVAACAGDRTCCPTAVSGGPGDALATRDGPLHRPAAVVHHLMRLERLEALEAILG